MIIKLPLISWCDRATYYKNIINIQNDNKIDWLISKLINQSIDIMTVNPIYIDIISMNYTDLKFDDDF